MADVTEQASYSSSDEDVATVNGDGVITAESEGTATITVTYEGESAEVSVTVEEPEPELQGINVSPSNVELEPGDNQDLSVEANYE